MTGSPLEDLVWKPHDGSPLTYTPESRLPMYDVKCGIDPAMMEQVVADQRLAEEAGFDDTSQFSFPLTEAHREELRRQVAAKRDKAMLGDSGYERIEADFYPTPAENVDCLLQHFEPHQIVWEPACGRGDISERLSEFGRTVISTDLYDQGFGEPGMDFLSQSDLPQIGRYADDGPAYAQPRAIITNPPYADGMAEKFCRHAIKLMEPVRGQVAMFLRNEFDSGKGRMELFGMPPFHKKIVVTKRPRWIEGSTGSPRHNYAWFIWDWRHKAGPASITYSHPDFAPSPVKQ